MLWEDTLIYFIALDFYNFSSHRYLDIFLFFLSNDIISTINITYKRLIQDILLVLVIFTILFVYYYLYFLVLNHKKNSLLVLKHTSYFIFSLDIIFLITISFVQEKMNIYIWRIRMDLLSFFINNVQLDFLFTTYSN